MKEGPDISIVAALIGNPASANMLMALLAGPALTATELAQESGLSLSTASGHLAKLEKAGLVAIARQGRHRYFRLADPDVAIALEGLMPVAARAGHLRVRTGPRDPELRRARSCYDHLAGHLAVTMLDRLVERRLLTAAATMLRLTEEGRRFFAQDGIDLGGLRARPAGALPMLPGLERAPQSPRRGARRRRLRPYRGAGLGGARGEDPDRAVFRRRGAENDGLDFRLTMRQGTLRHSAAGALPRADRRAEQEGS